MSLTCKCGSHMVPHYDSRHGAFYGCFTFPDCDERVPFDDRHGKRGEYQAVQCGCGKEDCEDWFVAPVLLTAGVVLRRHEAERIASVLNGARVVEGDTVAERLARACALGINLRITRTVPQSRGDQAAGYGDLQFSAHCPFTGKHVESEVSGATLFPNTIEPVFDDFLERTTIMMEETNAGFFRKKETA